MIWIGIAAVAMLGGIAVWLIKRAYAREREAGSLDAQAKALAEGQKRAERAKRKANRPITGDPKVLARRMRERLRRHQRELSIDDLELPPDS